MQASPIDRQLAPDHDAARALAPADLGLRLQAFALAELQAAQRLLAHPGEARHEGVHQARKRLRRSRAALALGRRRLGASAERLDDDLGQLCRGLSPLRDAQALLEGLDRLAHTAPESLRTDLPELMRLARLRRDETLAQVLSRDPDFTRRRARLQALATRLARLDWSGIEPKTVAAAVARSEKRLHKARRGAEHQPDNDECWHTLRRRVRRLRQQDHLLAQVQPGLRPAEGVPVEVATALSEAQDDALVLRHCGRRSPFPPALRRNLRALVRWRLRESRAPAPEGPGITRRSTHP